MSGIEEKLCPNCGYAMGKPGPVKVRIGSEEVYVHDLPDVTAIEHSIICVCCGVMQHWTTDCVELRLDVERKKRAKEKSS